VREMELRRLWGNWHWSVGGIRRSSRENRMALNERRFWLTLPSLAVRGSAGLCVIFLITVFYRHAAFFNETAIGFTYLLAILCASTLWGLDTSILMSISATLSYDYFFLPPIGEFTISDPRNWVALASFLITAVLGSTLAAWARREAEESDRRRREAERLYEFSQRLLSADRPTELLSAIPRHVVESFSVTAAALFVDGQQVHYWGVNVAQLDCAEPKRMIASGDLEAKAEQSICVTPILLGGREIGGIHVSRPAPSRATLEAMGTLITIAIERAGALESAAKMEAERQGEQLRSTLLESVTHDFRTPLTSIKGAVTGLLAAIDFSRDQQRELLTIINEECDRINQLVSAAAEMSRFEAARVKLDVKVHAAGELISVALADCKGMLGDRPLRVEAQHQELQVLADLSSAKKVLVHLVDNANLYSTPGQPIKICTEKRDGFLFFSVADQGPGIAEAEINRIFEKFYRGACQRERVPGTGMGLAIAKAITEAHGGTLEVNCSQGQGTTFTFSLPIESSSTLSECHA
jgi:two-component system sensor histidine kinase KdpD